MPSQIRIEPANRMVLVVDSTDLEKVVDGIELPGNQRQQDMVFGLVAFVGARCEATHPQDRVMYGPYAGKPVVINGSEFRLLHEDEIEAYIRTVDIPDNLIEMPFRNEPAGGEPLPTA